ncbi:MAG: S8 family peptidase [Hyphomonadaceae bacterium]
MTTATFARAWLHVLIALTLGACASGGGGGAGSGAVSPPPAPAPLPPPPPPPPPVAVPPLPPPAAVGTFPGSSSAEYTNNWGVEGVNADAAWQYENAHGEGVLIGIIDDGIIFDHPELQGRISAESTDIVPGRNALVSTNTHGAEVSSIVAANFNGGQTVGVAFGSTILAVRADNGSEGFNGGDLAAALDYAVAHGVRVVNFSLGSSNPTPGVLQDAIQRATNAGVIIVVSAGNDGPSATEPNYPGFLATDPTVAHGLVLVAGGTNPDGSFNTRSNPAGSTLQYYLTAPGWGIVVPDYGPPGPLPGFQRCWPDPNNCTGLVEIQGTSYASPHVAGAIAILMSAFPGLTSQQVVQILLQSTDDTGAAGVDSVTGRGRLNLGRAFQPIGTVAAPLVAGLPHVIASTPLGVVGAAFGDGMSDDPGEWAVAGFDAFGRTYALDLSSNWRRPAPGPSLIAQAPALWSQAHASIASMQIAPADDAMPASLRLQISREDIERPAVRIQAQLAPDLTLSFAADGADAAAVETPASGGHLAYLNADQTVRLTRAFGERLTVSAALETRSNDLLASEQAGRSAQLIDATLTLGSNAFTLSYGQMREERGLLGLTWDDALGGASAGEVRFGALSGQFALPAGWRLALSGEFGAGALAPRGWLSGDVATTAFSLEARRRAPWLGLSGDNFLSLSVRQPLRIEYGLLSALLPTATRYGRESLTYEPRLIDVTPSGRELQFGVSYTHAQSNSASAFLDATLIHDPGHVAGADDQALVRGGLRMRF